MAEHQLVDVQFTNGVRAQVPEGLIHQTPGGHPCWDWNCEVWREWAENPDSPGKVTFNSADHVREVMEIDDTRPGTYGLGGTEWARVSDLKGARVENLRKFWQKMTDEEIEKVIPKAVEYGSADLEVMGEAMKVMMRKVFPEEITPAQAMEMACAFYALGKVARMFGAFADGRMPNEDAAYDLGVYCRMIQKLRRTGTWL